MLVLAAPNLLRRRGSALDTPAAHYLTRSRPPELHSNILRNHLYRLPSLLSRKHIAFTHLALLLTIIASPQARRPRPTQRIRTR